MKIYKHIVQIGLIIGLFIFSGCEDFLEPEDDNRLTLDQVIANPVNAEGWLLQAYNGLPTGYTFTIDQASDDAETNDPAGNAKQVTNGGWTSDDNPFGVWNDTYEINVYLNTFIDNVDLVEWSYTNETRNELFRQRLTGEAHGLRAWYNFQLLQAHAGEDASGNLLGFPIVDRVLTNEDNLEIPRSSFVDCYNFIIDDLDIAIANLPTRYEDDGDAISNGVLGSAFINRMNGLAALLLKSRVALYAASPAYASSGVTTYQEAAQFAADVITANGGLNLSAGETEFYLDRDAYASELIWYSSRSQNQTNWESNNYPPSLFGLGRTNPTQDFVDVFPNLDGTPFDRSAVTNPADLYTDRDPRLDAYVIYNGSTAGPDDEQIFTYEFAPGGNGIGGVTGLATNTGYYLKKFLNQSVDLDPAQTVGAEHFYTYARMTEAYLNFAEAANEAVGPDGAIGGFSARQVINAIRTRGGITSTAHVDGLGTADMGDLIRNERRIELSFEGHRFWDIRRWEDLSAMQSSVSGMRINSTQDAFTVPSVGVRNYQDYMIYGPIPLSETQIYDITQNAGW